MLAKKLLKCASICFYVFLCACPSAKAVVSTGYTYIEVDNARSKWGDWDEPKHLKYFGLAMADVTGDGCKDIVSGRYVYLNPGGDMTDKWQRVDFGLNVDGMLFVNVDDDDFGDVIAEALPNVYWLEAEDAEALRWRATKIGTLPKTGHINGQGYILAQIVAGGKPEIVLSCGGGVYYFEIPANPEAGNWPRTRISPSSSEEGIGAGDIDGDGDIDIAVGISREGTKKGEAKTVAWLENPGDGSDDWNIYPVGTTVYFADRFAVAEVNGDGKADIIVTEESGRKHGASVYWFGQPTDCKNPNWPRHTVTVQNTTNNLDIADIDNDGDIDIITAEHRGTKKMQIFENDGKANFTEHVIDEGKESHLGARVADLDNDGDLDIVSIAWDEHKFLHVWRNDAVSVVIPFEHSIIDSNGPHNPWMKMTGDVDGDGHADIIIGGQKGPLVWYRWPNWDKAVISEGGYSTVDGAFGDIDGDGDCDIVMGGLVWYENPQPVGCPAEKLWKAHKIADHPTHDVRVADLDRDGDLDIVTRNQSEFGHKAGNKIYVWLQKDTDTWDQHVISCPHGEGSELSDIDNDGDKDIIIPGFWFENTKDIVDGVWKEHRYGRWHKNAWVQTADINGDGRTDIVLAPAEFKGDFYRISWFQAPSEPKTGKWVEHVIEDHIECIVHALATVDINGDGVVDVVTAEMHQGIDPDEVAVYINKDKGLAWAKQVLSVKGSHCIQAADFDNDGDPDIIGANHGGSYQVIEMWENKRKSIRQVKWKHLTSQNRDIPLPNVGRQAASLILDIDKDGVNDFVIAGWSDPSMVWMRHTADGWKRYLVDNRKSHIEAGGTYWDIDGDGDLDILQGGSWATNEVWWWENPYPNFEPDTPWNRYIIKNFGAKQHHDQIFGDFDGDGRAELVFWNQRAQKLLIADIPANPKDPQAWSFTQIWSWPHEFKYEGLAKADIDLDGKIDLIGGGHWFKHNSGTSYAANKIDDYGTSRSAAGDLIKGGRPEIVLGSGDGVGPLNLYEYSDGGWVKHTLIDKVDHGHSLQVGDINGDGNLDIYAAEMYRPGPGVTCRQWVLYGSGTGKFTIQLISTGIGAHEARIGDLDGDGDIDILQKDFQEHRRVDIWINE